MNRHLNVKGQYSNGRVHGRCCMCVRDRAENIDDNFVTKIQNTACLDLRLDGRRNSTIIMRVGCLLAPVLRKVETWDSGFSLGSNGNVAYNSGRLYRQESGGCNRTCAPTITR
jgi:hypothetical protein